MQTILKNRFCELAEEILEIDSCVIAAGFTDEKGEGVCLRMSNSLSIERQEELSSRLRKNSFGPALITSILNHGEQIFGKTEYFVASYGKVKMLLMPFKHKGVIALLLLTPNTDSRSIALQVKELLCKDER